MLFKVITFLSYFFKVLIINALYQENLIFSLAYIKNKKGSAKLHLLFVFFENLFFNIPFRLISLPNNP
jgi:hypothetical protein